ncbi:serine/threonine-protein kinase [Streptomyces sp. ADI93-02]|uniref:serine/threonine protein kinase n=1 Tax=Streptomyces sp. ADI93-02 TaxID=1522757 RepID=UPI000F551C36|nr:serine/threonine-protein kinase [Streptomyces sp. ADI93-02]RPK38381.1 Serine/threonine-protein kinase AfsK [Streptomyces sp. ADI93-02]
MRGLGNGEPRQVGRYRILGRLGAGGMGDVYLARSDRGSTVAIKLVREEMATQEEFRARFRYEVEAARRVGGHWTAPVLDADTEATVPWVATSYVAGPSLRQIVGRDHGPLPERSVRTLAAGLAHALQDIHGAGIVHRDLKPSNVLVTIDGPRVIDFGIARALETVTDGRLTRTGALVGSPGFMAPEQVRSDRITPASDIFCLGLVLLFAATGRMAFGSTQTAAHVLMYRIAYEEPDLEGFPARGVDLIRQCLEKDPAARPSLDEILWRTGAQDSVADGRSKEPWLPGPLLARLSRHAVGLLDTDSPKAQEPVTSPGLPSARASVAEAASLAEAMPTPKAHTAGTPAPVPPPRPRFTSLRREPQSTGSAAGTASPHRPSATIADQSSAPPHLSSSLPRKQKRTYLLIFILVLALSLGILIYNLEGENFDAKGNVIPERFLGDWKTTVKKKNGDHPRRMTLSQGKAGEYLLRMDSAGPASVGSGRYHCSSKNKLSSVSSDGTTLSFDRTILVSPERESDECYNMPPITLTMDLKEIGKVKRIIGAGLPVTFTRA